MTVQQCRVERLVGESLAYVASAETGFSYSVTPALFGGRPWSEIALRRGTLVRCEVAEGADIVRRAEIVPDPATEAAIVYRSNGDDSAASVAQSNRPKDPTVAQAELHPDDKPTGKWVADRGLPAATRTFGKIVDTAELKPGDLLLTRELNPDPISRTIGEVQEQGGYFAHHARWTHAALYVGDEQSVVEATFDTVLKGGSVRLTSLDAYCQRGHSLRFRRPRQLSQPGDGWKICVRALSRIGMKYDLGFAARMWHHVVRREKLLGQDNISRYYTVCSTLYSDAYNEATRRSLGEVNGICVPAWLSMSEAFEDIKPGWLLLS